LCAAWRHHLFFPPAHVAFGPLFPYTQTHCTQVLVPRHSGRLKSGSLSSLSLSFSLHTLLARVSSRRGCAVARFFFPSIKPLFTVARASNFGAHHLWEMNIFSPHGSTQSAAPRIQIGSYSGHSRSHCFGTRLDCAVLFPFTNTNFHCGEG
jgi:hypothetical protein